MTHYEKQILALRLMRESNKENKNGGYWIAGQERQDRALLRHTGEKPFSLYGALCRFCDNESEMWQVLTTPEKQEFTRQIPDPYTEENDV